MINADLRSKRAPIKIEGLRPGRFRGESAPSMAEIAAKITAIHTSFEAFKAKHTEQIAELKAGRDDVVTREHVDRINTDVGRVSNELTDIGRQLAALRLAPSRNDGPSPEAAAYASGFRGFIRKGHENGLRDLSIKAAMTTDSDPDGGYVVPDEIDATIARVMGTRNSMRQLATVRSTGASVFVKLHNLAGATTGWVGERAARPETNTPRLSEIRFPTHELYAMPAATQTLLDDTSLNVDSWLGEEIGIAFAEQEGDSFVDGDGVNKPRGFLSYSMAASSASSPSAWEKIGFTVTGVSGGLAADPDGADAILDLVYSLKSQYRANGSFIMNDASANRVRKLRDGDDNYLWQPMLIAGQPATLLGYPVVPDDNMPDFAANSFPIAFGDFARGYLIVDRIGTRVLRDPYSSKPYVLFYTTKRVGGGVQDFHAIKALKAAA